MRRLKNIKVPFFLVIPVALISMFCNTLLMINFIGAIFEVSNPKVTQTSSAIESLELTKAWIAYTQTMLAMPTQTFTPTNTETPTPQSTPTLANTATPQPTRTFTQVPTATPLPYVPPAQPTHPPGVTALCEDGTYSYSQTSRGTCSGHGGVLIWINKPLD